MAQHSEVWKNVDFARGFEVPRGSSVINKATPSIYDNKKL